MNTVRNHNIKIFLYYNNSVKSCYNYDIRNFYIMIFYNLINYFRFL